MSERHEQAYRGGALTVKPRPAALRYQCFATGCPMPGTIFLGAGVGGTGDRPGCCAWHYSVNDSDIPKVTQVLKDWSGLSYEVDECRRVHCNPDTASNPATQNVLFANAVERLRPFVQSGGWGEQFEANGSSYADWGRRLEAFLGARVVEVLSVHRRAA